MPYIEGESFFDAVSWLLICFKEVLGPSIQPDRLTPIARAYFSYLGKLRDNLADRDKEEIKMPVSVVTCERTAGWSFLVGAASLVSVAKHLSCPTVFIPISICLYAAQTISTPEHRKLQCLQDEHKEIRGRVLEGHRKVGGVAASLVPKSAPISILERLTTTTTSEPASDPNPTPDELMYTRQVLGMSRPRNGGATECCSQRPIASARPTVVELGIQQGDCGLLRHVIGRRVQQEHTRCPVCGLQRSVSASNNVDVMTPRDPGSTPDAFFANVGDEGLGFIDFDLNAGVSLCHWVHVFGETYSLCGLIYRTAREGASPRYSCKAYLIGGWWTSNNGGLVHIRHFKDNLDDDYKEHLRLFMRTALVTDRYGEEAVGYPSSDEEVRCIHYERRVSS